MLRTRPETEPSHDVTVPSDDLVPISHLELDLPAPTTGWLVELDRRHIPVVLDDVGRRSISRADARQLFDERRENEIRQREVAERQEREAIEADRVRRASIWGGISALDLPPGVAPATVMLQAAHDAQPRRTSVLEDALSNEGTTFHSFGPTPDGE